eukprot:CAMPEP_0182522168 /NCGR_PEP_ID=MMETSP1323-20130603/83_1 /TAXON_ID=236787 /ORGANISM="Florenciella parvula, Strain RCC1693" /LENGTH=71 /DNA_ID=CAMNT_0024730229 /DNA_START=68 /DNA_END=282 /DNA_ORIENTATION=-
MPARVALALLITTQIATSTWDPGVPWSWAPYWALLDLEPRGAYPLAVVAALRQQYYPNGPSQRTIPTDHPN